MKLSDLRQTFRDETGDTAEPYLWSDDKVDRYLNEAESDAARRAGLLVDSQSEASECEVLASELSGDLHQSVIYIRRARMASGGQLVPRVSRAMDEEFPGWEDSSASTPMIFVPDWQSGKLRLWPNPQSNVTVKMTVVRTPLEKMVADSDEPEIPERYHPALVYGAMARAYLKQDSDTFDAQKSADNEALFAAEFGPRVSAIDEHWAIEQYYDIGQR